jgi:hypothetical protein
VAGVRAWLLAAVPDLPLGPQHCCWATGAPCCAPARLELAMLTCRPPGLPWHPAQVIEAQPSLSNGASATVDVAARELPSDQDFRWAQDDYNATQRTIDTWTFFTVFRTRLWLLDQKWSYPGEAGGGSCCRPGVPHLLLPRDGPAAQTCAATLP